jgi:hypothetical protein
MAIDCKHNRRMLIQGSSGSAGRDRVYLCPDCGEFTVSAEKDGAHFNLKFSLYSNAALIAASQSVARQKGADLQKKLNKRVWKPLDLGHLRLYEVRLYWCMTSGRQGKEVYIVAADSPNQTPNSAANQIRRQYADTYDSNPLMSWWNVEGYPLQVLQPLEWSENGISLFNFHLLEAIRRLQGSGLVDDELTQIMADEDVK